MGGGDDLGRAGLHLMGGGRVKPGGGGDWG